MRGELRPGCAQRVLGRYAALALAGALSACSLATLTRPEGNGGWNAAQRHEELDQRAAAAGVDFDRATSMAAAMTHQPPAAAIHGPLDLAAALDLATKRNRPIAEALTQVESARERVADVRGRLLPATMGSGRYTWYSDAQTVESTLPAAIAAQLPAGTPSNFNIKIRDADFGVVNATLALPLDLSGEIRHALAAAQAGYRGETARLWATTLEQHALVVRAYFELLQARRLREVTEQTVELDKQQLAVAASRFENGRVTKNDLLVVQVALQNAEQQLVQRDLAIADARWTFNQVVGADVNAATELVDVRARPKVPTPSDALRAAYEHNPVLVSLIEEQQRLDETVRSLERSRLPRFSAGGAIDYSSSRLQEPQSIGSGFTGFTWDLGTDTRREAEIADARVAADRNRVIIERQLRELEAAIRSTQLAAEERLAALAAAEAAVSQAEENLRIRQQQFEVGRAQSDDVLEAEALLRQQRATLATALYQAHTRRAELQQLIGLPIADAFSDITAAVVPSASAAPRSDPR